MRIILTGGNGQLAFHIKSNLNKKHELICFNRKQLNIVNYDNVLSKIKKYKPDLVINTAAFTNVDACEKRKVYSNKINSIGPKNLAIITKDFDIPLIHFSTDYVYDGLSRKSYKEIDSTNPLSFYGKSKLNGDNHIRSISKKYIIFRTSWLFGSTNGNFVSKIIKKGKKIKNLKIINDQIGVPTSYEDLSKITWNAINLINTNSNIYGLYNFRSSGISITWYNFARIIFELAKKYGFSKDIKIKPITTNQYKKLFNNTTNRPKYSVLNSSLSKKVFNFTGIKWQKSLDNSIKEILRNIL